MSAGDREAVHAAAEALNEAIATNDADAIERLLAVEWVLVDGDGIGSREKFVRLVRSGALAHSSMRTMDGTERIVSYGDFAIRTARVTNTAHFAGETFHADEWTTDVFARAAEAWVCVHSQATRVTDSNGQRDVAP